MPNTTDTLTRQDHVNLGELIAFAFIEPRMLGWEGKAEQVADLADAFHNLPRVMFWDNFDWSMARGMMQSYLNKWPDHRYDYVAMLDAIHSPDEQDKT